MFLIGLFLLQTVVLFDVMDNLLVDVNKKSFRLLQVNNGGSEQILDNVERYALYVAQSTAGEVESTVNRTNLLGKNISEYTQKSFTLRVLILFVVATIAT